MSQQLTTQIHWLIPFKSICKLRFTQGEWSSQLGWLQEIKRCLVGHSKLKKILRCFVGEQNTVMKTAYKSDNGYSHHAKAF